MIRKVYVRQREGVPINAPLYAAYDGFWQMGCEVAFFDGFGDIEKLTDLGPEVALCGYVGDVLAALDRCGVARPEPLDYPGPLLHAYLGREVHAYLGREVRRSTIGEVRRGVERVFMKPVQHKLFTGFIWDPTTRWNGHETFPDETPVWASEVLPPIVSEYRVFVHNHEVVGVKHYAGSPYHAPRESFVQNAVAAYKPTAPVAYSLDCAVLNDSFTVLIEVNDSFALGSYGLESKTYARMVAARWQELVPALPKARHVLDPNRPKSPELAAILQRIYAKPEGFQGCCLHVVSDDDNHSPGTYEFVLQEAIAKEAAEPERHADCVAAARLMTRMTCTQVIKACQFWRDRPVTQFRPCDLKAPEPPQPVAAREASHYGSFGVVTYNNNLRSVSCIVCRGSGRASPTLRCARCGGSGVDPG